MYVCAHVFVGVHVCGYIHVCMCACTQHRASSRGHYLGTVHYVF